MRYLGMFAIGLCSLGCATTPMTGVEAVRDFELDRYLGTWYEIARLDHPFERGMRDVTANYTLREDGFVGVENRGFHEARGTWSVASGKARFRGASDVGSLEVSFFGPFYGGYHIVELDDTAEDYGYALVLSGTPDYLWILAREPEMDEALFERLVARAEALGVNTDGLIRVAHTTEQAADYR